VSARYVKQPVGAHYGLGAWLLQRLTAVIMVAYTVFMGAVLLSAPPATHAEWRALFQDGVIRVTTMLFLLALLYHAWVGVRDVLMDYIKPVGARLALQSLLGFVLVAYAVWAAAILWGR